ncbi:MAG: AmmeMemoRadiSam system protein B [bacterium]|nr:AmmeMemoRadiSam system protein B [bacterium]
MKKLEIFLYLFVFIMCMGMLRLSPGGVVVGDTYEPVVAGQFYPGTEKELSKALDEIFEEVPKTEEVSEKPLVLIVPHAGYIYSGSTAGYGYYQLRNFKYNTIIIMGPTHRVPLTKVSVGTFKYFKTPLKKSEVDVDLANALIEKSPDNIGYDPSAFKFEHSVEVQVPFIQKLFPDAKILPIVMPENGEAIKALSEAIVSVMKDRDDILLVASTDMSHFHDSKEAMLLDRKAIEYIEDMDYAGLIDGINDGECELCGIGPVLTVMLAAEKLGATTVKTFKYSHSGMVSGDNKKVVGYFSAVIYKSKTEGKESEGMLLNKEQKKELLKIARETITGYLKTGKAPEFTVTDPKLKEKFGCFVTLNMDDDLRGCIGHFEADTPLYKIVSKMAIQSSQHDPRFNPVTLKEMDRIEIEISVLSPLTETKEPLSIKKGIHGIYIQDKSGYRGGTYLPQVWSEHFPDEDAEYFWRHLCMFKAGFEEDAWKKPEKYIIMIYTAEIFSEKEFK